MESQLEKYEGGASARVEEFELSDLIGYQQSENVDVQDTDLGGTKTLDDVFNFVHEWEYELLEDSFRKNIQKLSDMSFSPEIKKYLNKNLIEYKSKRGKTEFFIIVDKNSQNQSAYKIKIGNDKYATKKAMKITENGVVNNISTLEQKLGKNNELVQFLKNYKPQISEQIHEQINEPQKFNIYGSQTAKNEEFEVHNTKIEIEKRNKSIENVERLMSGIKDVRDDIKNLYEKYKILSPEETIPKSVIEEGVRPMLQAKELNNVLTDDDRQLITKYLDFIEKNKEKIIQLQNDIKYYEKEIKKSENQLLSETNDDQVAILKQFIDSSKAKMITSQKLIDQILAYNEKQYEVINSKLKTKFTVKEKLIYIFKKYGLTITAISLGLGLIIETIVRSVGISGGAAGGGSAKTNITDKIKQSLKNFANWLLEMSKKALDNLPAIIGSIISFLLKATAGIVGFLAEHIILFVIALAFALYEALKIGYNDFKQRKH